MFCTTDIPPGGGSPLHRTDSLDYAIVVSGEIVLKMESGEETVIKPGEIVLQRGTMHSWTNRSQDFCRIAFVLVGSEKVVLKDGTILE
jgi:quercetin dioxygenase-like cupin family protein